MSLRALERASSYFCGPCPTVAVFVGRVSGLVLCKAKLSPRAFIAFIVCQRIVPLGRIGRNGSVPILVRLSRPAARIFRRSEWICPIGRSKRKAVAGRGPLSVPANPLGPSRFGRGILAANASITPLISIFLGERLVFLPNSRPDSISHIL